MRQQESHRAWCGTCGTEHADPRLCPGDLRATGPETPGWRVIVETPFGNEAIGVLLAPSHDVWRARVVTYPNILWTVPGGRGTIKFVGETREDAERRAVAFVSEHVHVKRYLRRDGLAPVESKRPTGGVLPPKALRAISNRKPTCLPVRFGVDRAMTRGTTINLSDEGMFIGAVDPQDGGRALHIHLEVNGHTLPLRGLVMWSRRRHEPGRPLGMGVRLSQPPPFYSSFVASLNS